MGEEEIRLPLIHSIEKALNHRISDGGGAYTVGEEEIRLPLIHSIEKALHKLGVPGNIGKSWVIDCEYDFKKPRPDSSIVES